MEKVLPKEITSYDLLKAAAVILMIADHIGFYLFTGHLWWRVIGRFCVPIWFFLVGYSTSRDISPKLWAGALILLASNFVFGLRIIPVNILFTIIAIRLTIDPVMRFALQGRARMAAVAVLMLLLLLPTSFWTSEYGTQGFLIAMFGYTARHRSVVKGGRYANVTILVCAILALAGFIPMQRMSFRFSSLQFMVMAAGTVLITCILYMFRPAVYPRLTASCPAALRRVIQFMGRRTLEIYVVHLLALRALALHFQPAHFALFAWKWH